MKSNAQGAEFGGVTGLWKSTLAEWEWAMGKQQGTQQENLLPATGSYMLSGGGKKRRGVEVQTTTVFWLWFCSENLIVEPEGLLVFKHNQVSPEPELFVWHERLSTGKSQNHGLWGTAEVLRLLPVSSLPNSFSVWSVLFPSCQLPEHWVFSRKA